MRSRAWAVEAPADFPPLVDEGPFRAAQAVLSRKGAGVVHNRQHPDFALKHFVRCDECRPSRRAGDGA